MKGWHSVSFWLFCLLLLAVAKANNGEFADGDPNEAPGPGQAQGQEQGPEAAMDEQQGGGEAGGEAAGGASDDYDLTAGGTGAGGEADEFGQSGRSKGGAGFDEDNAMVNHGEGPGMIHPGLRGMGNPMTGYGGHGIHGHDEGSEEEEHEAGHEDQGSEESEESTEESSESQRPEVEFHDFSEAEHMRAYKKISADMKVYEDEYSACIREIPDSGYTEEALDECLGKNFIKVTLDLKYIILKVMAKADTKVRQTFIEHCYNDAGVNEQFSTACDLLERDILDMLWNGLDFLGLVDLNKHKYLLEWGEMPEETYQTLVEELSKLSKAFFELLDELDSHKELTVLRIKTLIDDRTKLILEEAQNHPDMVEPATVTHRIEISETVDNDDGSGVNFLPTTQFHDGTERRMNLVNQNGDKHNSLRSLNSGTGYNELNGANRMITGTTRDRFQRNEQMKRMMMVRLGSAARAQARTPFKNIHTTHYSKVSK